MNHFDKKPIELPSIDVSTYEFSMEAQKEMRTILFFGKALNINSKEEIQVVKKSRRPDIPVWERSSLTIDQAAVYCGVGKDKLRELTDREDCPFVLWVGSKRLIRRKKLDEYLDKAFSI